MGVKMLPLATIHPGKFLSLHGKVTELPYRGSVSGSKSK
jgi:hypothetical protein